MTGIDDVHIEPAQVVHRRQIGLHIGLRQGVDEPAVVDRVARDQRAFLVVDEPDAARRVPGQVDDAEPAVAEVDLVAALHQVGRGGRRDAERRRIESRVRQGVDQ